jgi:two-component system sensor histidine kinase UhpB
VLDDLGLAAAAAWLVQRTRTRTAIECRLELSPRLESLPGEVAVTAFRILQESLTNVSRHSRATHAEISIHLAEDGLLLRVADDGIGLQRSRSAPGAAPRGMGLIGMRERARALGGEASVTESSAGGTVVEVRLQVAQARGESVQ